MGKPQTYWKLVEELVSLQWEILENALKSMLEWFLVTGLTPPAVFGS